MKTRLSLYIFFIALIFNLLWISIGFAGVQLNSAQHLKREPFLSLLQKSLPSNYTFFAPEHYYEDNIIEYQHYYPVVIFNGKDLGLALFVKDNDIWSIQGIYPTALNKQGYDLTSFDVDDELEQYFAHFRFTNGAQEKISFSLDFNEQPLKYNYFYFQDAYFTHADKNAVTLHAPSDDLNFRWMFEVLPSTPLAWNIEDFQLSSMPTRYDELLKPAIIAPNSKAKLYTVPNANLEPLIEIEGGTCLTGKLPDDDAWLLILYEGNFLFVPSIYVAPLQTP